MFGSCFDTVSIVCSIGQYWRGERERVLILCQYFVALVNTAVSIPLDQSVTDELGIGVPLFERRVLILCQISLHWSVLQCPYLLISVTDELGSVVPQVERRVLILCQYFVALVSIAVSIIIC